MIFFFILLAGLFEGLMDYLQFKYYEDNGFWNPRLSWDNKWKFGEPVNGERFWQSSRALVFLTDGWHLMKWFRNRNIDMCSLIVCMDLGCSFIASIFFVVLVRTLYGVGFAISYRARS